MCPGGFLVCIRGAALGNRSSVCDGSRGLRTDLALSACSYSSEDPRLGRLSTVHVQIGDNLVTLRKGLRKVRCLALATLDTASLLRLRRYKTEVELGIRGDDIWRQRLL
jgi:hypothetical protein